MGTLGLCKGYVKLIGGETTASNFLRLMEDASQTQGLKQLLPPTELLQGPSSSATTMNMDKLLGLIPPTVMNP